MEIKVKDNAFTNKDEFEGVRLLTQKVADKTLEQLEKEGVFVFPEVLKDAEDITKEQMILQSVNNGYRARSLRQKYLLLPNKLRSYFHKLYLFRSH